MRVKDSTFLVLVLVLSLVIVAGVVHLAIINHDFAVGVLWGGVGGLIAEVLRRIRRCFTN